jgi:hypothetical protein
MITCWRGAPIVGAHARVDPILAASGCVSTKDTRPSRNAHDGAPTRQRGAQSRGMAGSRPARALALSGRCDSRTRSDRAGGAMKRLEGQRLRPRARFASQGQAGRRHSAEAGAVADHSACGIAPLRHVLAAVAAITWRWALGRVPLRARPTRRLQAGRQGRAHTPRRGASSRRGTRHASQRVRQRGEHDTKIEHQPSRVLHGTFRNVWKRAEIRRFSCQRVAARFDQKNAARMRQKCPLLLAL